MSLISKEKQVVIIAFACIAILIAFQVFMRPALNRSETLKRVIPEKKAALAQMKSKSNQYNSLKEKLGQIRSSVESQNKDKKILSSIEQIQKDCGLTKNVVNMIPSTMEISEEYEKNNVDIKYNELTLSQIVRFIQKVETSDLLIGIESMEIKRGKKNPALLDLDIQLVSVSYIE